ncbi:MAG: hypothetical protein EZS28_048316 [Streblomastix strix]|uniref:Uncharacterized protein n=1 Tax=Streblomastix strix TaxID=222440 RepID=A0A5J4TD93_9EUKA|nr:MAG: hypothetical protein EZS28_048316 [Streblomastix strix]
MGSVIVIYQGSDQKSDTTSTFSKHPVTKLDIFELTGRTFILEQNDPITEVKAQCFYSKSGRRLLDTQFQLTTLDKERV